MFKALITLLFFMLSLQATSYKANINNVDYVYDDFKMSYLKDTKEEHTIDTISKYTFTDITHNAFSLGYKQGSIWLKVDISNLSTEENFILTLNEIFYEKANLYYKQNNNWIKKENSLFTPLKDREVKSNKLAFKLFLPKLTHKTIYIELKGQYSYFGKVSLFKAPYFHMTHVLDSNTFFIFIMGIAFIILLFNVALFITLQEKIYFYYSGYALFTFIFLCNSSGLLVFFNLQHHIYTLHMSIAFFVAFLILFSTELLNTKHYAKRLHRPLHYLALFFFLFGFIFFFDYKPWNQILNNLGFLVTTLLSFLSLYVFIKGERRSIYYTFALFIYLFSATMFILMLSNVLPYNSITRYSFMISMAFENVVFSLLIVSRYNNMKNSILSKLESKVEQRTFQLKQSNDELQLSLKERSLLLKELYHRVKNNFHLIIAMLWMEGNKKSQQALFEPIITRIESMSLVHEYLYDSKQLNDINTAEFFRRITQNIQLREDEVKIKEHYALHTPIELKNAICLGMVVNEAVTNSIKHNRHQENLVISLQMYNVKQRIFLSIQDNGQGFDTKEKSDGLGLKLVHDFSHSLKNVKLNITSNKGVLIELSYDEEEQTS